MPYHVYIALSGDDKISIFDMDPDTGGLAHRTDVAVPGRPAPLALHPDRRFLYAGRRDALEVSAYAVDAASGDLSPVGSAPLEADPCYFATDKTGRYLFSAYYFAGKVAVHRIQDDGSVANVAVEWLDTAPGAHSIQTDASNRFAFVPHIAGSVGPNVILQFRFDESSGRLSPNSPSRVDAGDELGPRHFRFHPTLDVVYFSNEQGCSVTAYGFDATAGTLTAMQTVSTLPDGYSGDNTCAQIQITPSGRFLCAPNRGHDSIACFSIDPATGRLDRTAVVPTEPVPRAIGLDPGGNFLLAAGLDSGRLATYRIDQDNGQLEHLATRTVGSEPMWVLINDLGGGAG